jgi:phosphate transport system protein
LASPGESTSNVISGAYHDDVKARDFAKDLNDIDLHVTQLFALVSEGLRGATDALLASDQVMAEKIILRDQLIDRLYLDIEEMVQRQFALQAPVATDMRYLLSMLRIVPELERSGDLVRDIAKRVLCDLGSQLSSRTRGLIERMGMLGTTLWESAGAAYLGRDPKAHERMRILDDELDELHVVLIAEIIAANLSSAVSVELALVARFYERLGDHAVNIASRIRFVAGDIPRPSH